MFCSLSAVIGMQRWTDPLCQLRSVLKTYGVPWGFPIAAHPMVDWIQPYMPSKVCVARIYRKLIEATMKPLSVTALWNRELAALNYTPEWGTNGSNLK